jgi:hypothetical protein
MARRSALKGSTPKRVSRRAPSRRPRSAARAPRPPALHTSDGSAPSSGTMARTVADAQAVGRAALRLAYDVGAVLGLAARGLVSATLDVADTVAPRRSRPEQRDASVLPALRKPPVAIDAVKRPRGRTRRLAG